MHPNRQKGSWKLNRRFIVVEGIYANTGDVAPLKAIAALKHKWVCTLPESIASPSIHDSQRLSAVINCT